MLDRIVRNVIARYNIRKIAPDGKLHSSLEDGPEYRHLEDSQEYSRYRLDFLFNPLGIIVHSGDLYDLPPEVKHRYHHGFFIVAADTSPFTMAAHTGVYQERTHTERIIDVSTKNPVICATAELWNNEYGLQFDTDYKGSAAGLMDEDAEDALL